MGRRKYYIVLVCITTVHTMLLCNSQCQPCNSRAYSAIPVPTVQTWHGRHGNATAFYLCPLKTGNTIYSEIVFREANNILITGNFSSFQMHGP